MRADQIKNADTLDPAEIDHVVQPADAIGLHGVVLQPRYKSYEDRIWDILDVEVETKIKKLLLNLTSEDPKAKGPKYQRLKNLPWLKKGLCCFVSQSADQPTYGSATGFIAGSGFVATAGHAISIGSEGPEIGNYKVVFNLRKETFESPGNSSASSSSTRYKFDSVFDIKR